MEQIVQKGLEPQDIDYEATYALDNEKREFKSKKNKEICV